MKYIILGAIRKIETIVPKKKKNREERKIGTKEVLVDIYIIGYVSFGAMKRS